jgi:hypothetical protein
MSASAEAHCRAAGLELITKRRSNGESMMITRDQEPQYGMERSRRRPCKEFEIADEPRVSWRLAAGLLAAAIIGIVLMLIADGALLR